MWERSGRSVIRLDQKRPRRPGREWIAEILRLAGDLSVAEFHDAYSVRWHAVIVEHEFGDPEVAVADDPLDGEALLIRLHRSALLNLASAANAFARLRVVEHRILAINLMLDCEVIRIGCGPVAFERSPYLAIFHLDLPPTSRRDIIVTSAGADAHRHRWTGAHCVNASLTWTRSRSWGRR